MEFRASDLRLLLPPRPISNGVALRRAAGQRRTVRRGRVADGAACAAMTGAILYSLWLNATLQGVGYARGIARLTQTHLQLAQLTRSSHEVTPVNALGGWP